jgi:hypothetical protein
MAQMQCLGNVGIIIVGSLIGVAALVALLAVTGYLPLNVPALILSPGTKSEYTEPILSKVISVEAGEFQYQQFKVPADVSVPIVRGSFLVSGGNAEDINVMIVDEDGFAAWQNGQAPKGYHYFSSEVITADLEANVPSGMTLYLVFDNRHSLAAKIIEVDIELAYLR